MNNRLSVVSLWISGLTLLTMPCLLLLSLVPATASLAVAVVAYRRSRTGDATGQTRGAQALAAGVVAVVLSLGIAGVAVVVSGPAIVPGWG